ncbi:hypothetical protein CSC16_3282 [Proteus mirabilis]|nr:hypothetical protein CSC16_3282 [Proteus mirabilis]
MNFFNIDKLSGIFSPTSPYRYSLNRKGADYAAPCVSK